MGLLKNNTSLKKYFAIMTTKKHRTPRAGLTREGRWARSRPAAGPGNRGPPRAGETVPVLLGRDHDRALRGQAGRSSRRLTLHAEGFLFGSPELGFTFIPIVL